jgi:CheY-like chemotaxis protein
MSISIDALIWVAVFVVALFLFLMFSSNRKAERQRIRRASTYQEPISGFESRKALERMRKKATHQTKTGRTTQQKTVSEIHNTRIQKSKVKEETSSESTIKRLSEPDTGNFPEPSTLETVDSGTYIFLVVDDSKVARNFAEKSLKNAFPKSDVVLASDGVDAWSKLEEITPDVIISDIDMPRVDGIEFKRRVRNDLRFADIPIILISTHVGHYVKLIQDKPGLSGFLPKPYEQKDLVSQIEFLLDGGLFN